MPSVPPNNNSSSPSSTSPTTAANSGSSWWSGWFASTTSTTNNEQKHAPPASRPSAAIATSRPISSRPRVSTLTNFAPTAAASEEWRRTNDNVPHPSSSTAIRSSSPANTATAPWSTGITRHSHNPSPQPIMSIRPLSTSRSTTTTPTRPRYPLTTASTTGRLMAPSNRTPPLSRPRQQRRLSASPYSRPALVATARKPPRGVPVADQLAIRHDLAQLRPRETTEETAIVENNTNAPAPLQYRPGNVYYGGAGQLSAQPSRLLLLRNNRRRRWNAPEHEQTDLETIQEQTTAPLDSHPHPATTTTARTQPGYHRNDETPPLLEQLKQPATVPRSKRKYREPRQPPAGQPCLVPAIHIRASRVDRNELFATLQKLKKEQKTDTKSTVAKSAVDSSDDSKPASQKEDTDTWTCPNCSTSNASNDTECVQCKAKRSVGRWGNLFQRQFENKWKCRICSSYNDQDEDPTQCASCGAARIVTANVPAAAAPAAMVPTGFSFGTGATNTTATTATTATTTGPATTTTTFSFQPFPVSAPAPTGQDGNTVAAAPTGFLFGVPPTTNPVSTETLSSTAKPPFSFGSTESSSSNQPATLFSFGANKTEPSANATSVTATDKVATVPPFSTTTAATTTGSSAKFSFGSQPPLPAASSSALSSSTFTFGTNKTFAPTAGNQDSSVQTADTPTVPSVAQQEGANAPSFSFGSYTAPFSAPAPATADSTSRPFSLVAENVNNSATVNNNNARPFSEADRDDVNSSSRKRPNVSGTTDGSAPFFSFLTQAKAPVGGDGGSSSNTFTNTAAPAFNFGTTPSAAPLPSNEGRFGSADTSTNTLSAPVVAPSVVNNGSSFAFGSKPFDAKSTVSDGGSTGMNFSFGAAPSASNTSALSNSGQPISFGQPASSASTGDVSSQPFSFGSSAAESALPASTPGLGVTSSSTSSFGATNAAPSFGATNPAPSFGVPMSNGPLFGNNSGTALGNSGLPPSTFGSTSATAPPSFSFGTNQSSTTPTPGIHPPIGPFQQNTNVSHSLPHNNSSTNFGFGGGLGVTSSQPWMGSSSNGNSTFGSQTAPPMFGSTSTPAPAFMGFGEQQSLQNTGMNGFESTSQQPSTMGFGGFGTDAGNAGGFQLGQANRQPIRGRRIVKAKRPTRR